MSSPKKAFANAPSEVGLIANRHDFAREREESDRVLFTYRVGSSIKEAVIVADTPTLDQGKTGWHPETWAHCDLSEFPNEIAEQDGRQIWTDANGRRVPRYVLAVGAGPAHCNWDSATFLDLDGRTYIGDPPDGLVPSYVPDTYAEDIRVPASATDTGYSYRHRHLWIAADRRVAYVGTTQHAERWPAPTKEFGCA